MFHPEQLFHNRDNAFALRKLKKLWDLEEQGIAKKIFTLKYHTKMTALLFLLHSNVSLCHDSEHGTTTIIMETVSISKLVLEPH